MFTNYLQALCRYTLHTPQGGTGIIKKIYFMYVPKLPKCTRWYVYSNYNDK